MLTRTIQKSGKTAEVTTQILFWHQRRPVNIQRCSSPRVYRSDPSSRNYTPRPSHPSFRHSLPPHPLDTMLHRHHQSTSFYYKSTFVLSATSSGVSTIPPPPPVPPPPLPPRHLPRRAGRCSTSSTRAVPSTATSICAHRPSRRYFKRHGPAVPSHHRRKKSQPHLAQSSHFHLHLVHLFHEHPEPAGVAVYSGISPSKQRVRTYAHET